MVWDYHLINIQVVLPKNHPFQFCHNFSMYLRWWSGKLGLNVGGQEWKRCLALLLQTTSCLGKLISEPYTTRWPDFREGPRWGEMFALVKRWKDCGLPRGFTSHIPGWWNFWWSSVPTPQKCMKRCVLMGYKPAASERRFWRRPTVLEALGPGVRSPWNGPLATPGIHIPDEMHPRLHLHTLVGTWCSTIQV